MAPWRLLFLVLGSFSILWAVFLYFFLPDSPTTCWYFSDREKYICVTRLEANNTGLEDKTVKWYQVRECLLDPKTWLLALFAVAQNIPNGGLVTFSSIIVSGLGYSRLETTLLGIPTGVLATVWQLVWSFVVVRFPGSRCITIAFIDIFTLICGVLMWKLPRTNKHGLLAAYYCFYTYWGEPLSQTTTISINIVLAPYVLATSLPMANTSGHSKKLTMNAMFFLAYCVGNIIGPQVFRASDAPDYSHGYVGLLSCIAVAIAAIIAYGTVCAMENRQRDREQADGIAEDDEEVAFSDLTDKQKRSFRYIY